MTCTLLSSLMVAGSGCDWKGDETLVIATNWTAAERDGLEAGFRAWVKVHPDLAIRPFRIVWIILAEGRDPTAIVGRVPVDLVLGGPAASYDRLAAEGRLDNRVIRRSPLGLAARRPIRAALRAMSGMILGEPEMAGRVALDDPRGAPITLEWAKARLGSGTWSQGYAELVRTAGNARAIGRNEGAAQARLERGEDVLVPVSLLQIADRAGVGFVHPDEAPDWVEGVGLMHEARHPARARSFWEFLGARPGTGLPSSPGGPRADPLLADLLGATLVDAQDELRAAWSALVRAGRPAAWEERMTAAPPWPPASVAALRGGPDAALWVETLAEQVAPLAEARDWLLTSWERPPRPIDGRFLDDLAGAAGGRLAQEPRFRAWLRGEWTAWARQRYRWVVREVEDGAR